MATGSLDVRIRAEGPAKPKPPKFDRVGSGIVTWNDGKRAPRLVRLRTDGKDWRVEVLQRSWLRFGQWTWCYVEFGVTRRTPSTPNEFIAREKFRETVAAEERRWKAKRDEGWRTVEELP